MNSKQKEVISTQLKDEKKVIDELKRIYEKSLQDVNDKIAKLMVDETSQSKIYQANYQKQLKKQIETSLNGLNSGQYKTLQDYLTGCYKTGFIGSMYDLHGQGIPLVVPIDQKALVKAVQLDSKISNGLYKRLGHDVGELKKQITNEVSRGISQAMNYTDLTRNLNNVSKVGLGKASRIARTEGHRIQQASAYDAQVAAKEAGADVFKQWDATLDGATRETHRKLDGQIVEIDEPFEENGMTAMFPGGFGKASEDCNCRCVSLQRARWDLDESELETLKERADYYGLDKTNDFGDFKTKYLNINQNT